jgi:ubiquinone/menaquinone biosynthesis C-methylase UbiE
MNQQGQWQVAGSAAEVYEKELVPVVFGPWAPLVIDLASPREGDRVLDVACGTGIVTRQVANRVGPSGAVVGVDLNSGMLKVARAAYSPASRSGGPIEWHEASAEKLPFPNASFNVVYCPLGLQFFADRAAALREMHRVLASGGRLGLMVWRSIDESPGFALLAEALDRHVGQAAANIMRAPFALSDANELATLVRNAGFQDVVIQQQVGTVRFPSVEKFLLSYVTGSPLAGPVSQTDDAARKALISDARNTLGKYTSNGELTFPIAAHLVSAKVSEK